jgi:predicted AAA+ superfamily ATPase
VSTDLFSTPSGILPRNVETLALATVKDTPVAIIQGARQVGKSTLASMLAAQLNSKQVTFDNPSSLLSAREDPLGFVEQHAAGTLVIDETQLFPQILRSIKQSVDENRRPGRFIITGSANLLHISGANESLAGRAETVRLNPFSQGEIRGYKEDFIQDLVSGSLLTAPKSPELLLRQDYARILAKGGYPGTRMRDASRRRAFYRNYLASILDHDAANISGLAHLDKLQLLYTLLAAQTSAELVKTNLAKLVGIPETSIHAYLRLLHDLYLVYELPAWGRNISKRAISRPKISLPDSGLASFLNKASEESLANISHSEMFGRLLESLVISELFKQQTWSTADYELYHFRDKDCREVDIIVELFDGSLIGLEVKAAQTVARKHFSGLRHLRELLKERFIGGFVLYTGQESLSFGDRLFAIPLCYLWGNAG